MKKESAFLKFIRINRLPRGLAGLIRKHENLILYLIIGGGAVVVDVGVFALLVAGTGMNELLANTVSVFAAIIYSFVLNARFNFKVTDKLWQRFISFTAVAGVGYLVSTAMLFILSDVMGMNAVLVKVLSLPVVLAVQFILNSRVTFNDKSTVATQGAK